MVVILVRWYIKKGEHEAQFIKHWEETMTIKGGMGLLRETLCRVSDQETDPKFHTFDLDNPYYTTFINIGMWESLSAFDEAVARPYIKGPKEIDGATYLPISSFEFKIRERIVLEEVSSRGDALPPAKLT